MVIDTISGVLKTLKLDFKKFDFKKLLWGLISKLGILIVPLVVALLFKGIGQDFGLGVMMIVKILIVSEFISSIGNIYTVKTGVVVKDIDIFTMLFKFLRSSALKYVSRHTKIEDDEPKKENDEQKK
jgi:phage-related holin